MEPQCCRSNAMMENDTKDFRSQSTVGSQKRIANELAFETELKKMKCGEIQPSPDLFDEDDDGMSIPQNNDERKYDDCANDDGQNDDRDAMQSNNVPFENPWVSNVQAAPPNLFTQSDDFNSVQINIAAIVAAFTSQSQQTMEIEPQCLPSLQKQEPEQKLQQQQPASDVPLISPKHGSADELIEELSFLFERVNKLIDEIKESS